MYVLNMTKLVWMKLKFVGREAASADYFVRPSTYDRPSDGYTGPTQREVTLPWKTMYVLG